MGVCGRRGGREEPVCFQGTFLTVTQESVFYPEGSRELCKCSKQSSDITTLTF